MPDMAVLITAIGMSYLLQSVAQMIFGSADQMVRLFDLDESFYQDLANDPFLKNSYQNHFDQ